MKRLAVRWTASAYQDLFEIVDFIKADSFRAAQKIAKSIIAGAAGLSRNPLRGRIAPELLSQGVSTYRQLLIPTYRLIYQVRDDVVRIDMVIDSRRNLQDILIRRLIR